MGFPGAASGKEPACQARGRRRRGFNPWVGKIPWRRKWQLQYSCLENPLDRGAWRAMIHGGTPNWTLLKPLSMHTKMEASKHVKRMLK